MGKPFRELQHCSAQQRMSPGQCVDRNERFVHLHDHEIRRNLRPNWATKIAKRANTCFLGKTQNGVESAIGKNN